VAAADLVAAVGSVAADVAGNTTRRIHMNRLITFILLGSCALAAPPSGKPMASGGKTFDTPMAAAQALVAAVRTGNTRALIAILGPSSRDIISSDPVEDQKVRRAFANRASERINLVSTRGKPNEKTLLAGYDDWPLPIPIVQMNGKWRFDMTRGRQEILKRRIGSNELDAIEICRGFVEAQDDYAEQHRTAEGVPYYAQKIISSPGERDGLYWEGEGRGDSPLGAIIARAIADGYTSKAEPFRGYYFKVLTAQGRGSSGLAINYIDGGVMSKGFALIAWPAKYGNSGIMTFVVNKSGIVYQKDLGKATAGTAAAFAKYDPDATWVPVSTRMASMRSR
jgi:hypothetical protein